MASGIPSNVHVSRHPCVRAKISQLRSSAAIARETKALVNDIALMVACEAFAQGFDVETAGTATSPLGYEYKAEKLLPTRISIMPILRSGLAMVDAVQTLLPEYVPIHHLGLFRQKMMGTAFEYYNNLREHNAANAPPSDVVILVDPVIATGCTAVAAIDTLRGWGAKRIIMLSIMSAKPGLVRAAEVWSEGVEIWTGCMDEQLDSRDMIKPGLGDVGDRLFLTIGK